MKILGVESSARAASVAILEDDRILAEFSLDTALTHSQTLMELVAHMFRISRISLDEIDLFGVSVGPGSFTGLRIGVSAVKGMAFGRDKPCCGVSTLEALAYGFVGEEALLCPVMDARCKQVYQAFFRCSGGKVERLSEDRVVPVARLEEELAVKGERVLLNGDGAEACGRIIGLPNVSVAAPHLRIQRGSFVAMAAQALFEQGRICTDRELISSYLVPCQAERELRRKQGEPKEPK